MTHRTDQFIQAMLLYATHIWVDSGRYQT